MRIDDERIVYTFVFSSFVIATYLVDPERNVADQLIVLLHSVFEEESLAMNVVQDNTFDQQIVSAVDRHAAIV